jgi:hypothetical protein
MFMNKLSEQYYQAFLVFYGLYDTTVAYVGAIKIRHAALGL